MKKLLILSAAVTAAVSGPVFAESCQTLRFAPNQIVSVKSSELLGSRVQLPSKLISPPVVSNPTLWDVNWIQGTNQLLIKPNSAQPNGKQTMVHAYTADGRVWDIEATRTTSRYNQNCLVVQKSGQDMQKISAAVQGYMSQAQFAAGNQSAEVAQLQSALSHSRQNLQEAKDKAVVNALRKYRYHIYTRYTWDEGKEFVGSNTISDVYDDGRFTYIRLANPNRGVLSVETNIGGKNAIAPVKYDDAYGMYRVTGIYPSFTLRVDDVKVQIARRDNGTQGAS